MQRFPPVITTFISDKFQIEKVSREASETRDMNVPDNDLEGIMCFWKPVEGVFLF